MWFELNRKNQLRDSVRCMQRTSPPAWDAPALAEALKRLRDRGYSASDLAALAGISRSQMSRWTSGGHRPGYDALRSLTTSLLEAHPSDEYRSIIADLCAAAGYPGIASDLGVTPPVDEHDETTEVASPYTGAVFRIVRNLEMRAEDAGLSEEEEREMIERAMVEAEKLAETIVDAELRGRLHRRPGDE